MMGTRGFFSFIKRAISKPLIPGITPSVMTTSHAFSEN